MWSEMVRDDCKIKKSSELLQREIRQFVWFWAPLDAGLLQDDEEVQALLPSHPTGSGVVRIDGLGKNSDDDYPELEEIEGVERLRGGGGVPRVSCGCGGLFIGCQGRRHGSWHRQAS
jgi:hypothetical protein